MYNFYLKPMAVRWGKEKTDATKLIYQSNPNAFSNSKYRNDLEKQRREEELMDKFVLVLNSKKK